MPPLEAPPDMARLHPHRRAKPDRDPRSSRPPPRPRRPTPLSRTPTPNIEASATGDHGAHARLLSEQKGWVEGTHTAGGFRASPRCPGLPAGAPRELAAALPLQQRRGQLERGLARRRGEQRDGGVCAEAGTKLDSTGTVSQKISTVHKVAGVTHVSDELLDDSQWDGCRAGLAVREGDRDRRRHRDHRPLGDGEPTGIRNTVGDLHAGRRADRTELMDSVLKAAGRLAEDFITPDTLVVLRATSSSSGSRPTCRAATC